MKEYQYCYRPGRYIWETSIVEDGVSRPLPLGKHPVWPGGFRDICYTILKDAFEEITAIRFASVMERSLQASDYTIPRSYSPLIQVNRRPTGEPTSISWEALYTARADFHNALRYPDGSLPYVFNRGPMSCRKGGLWSIDERWCIYLRCPYCKTLIEMGIPHFSWTGTPLVYPHTLEELRRKHRILGGYSLHVSGRTAAPFPCLVCPQCGFHNYFLLWRWRVPKGAITA